MPIKMGDKSYAKFEDASKSVQQSKGLPKERADAYVATIDRKQQGKEESGSQFYDLDVDEYIKTGEPTQKLPKDKRSYDVQADIPEEVQSLTTPSADDVKTEDPQDLTTPQGSLREVSPDSDIIKDNAYGKLNGDIDTDNEDENKNERREGHQSLEYNGSTYSKVESLEYNGKIYISRKATEEYGECPEGEVWDAEAETCVDESITQPMQYSKKAEQKWQDSHENDLEYDNKFWKQADEDVLELDNDHYVKDAKEEGDMIPNPQSSMPQPSTVLTTPELNPTSESIIIKESNGKYKKYNIFEVNEDDKKVDAIQSPAKVEDVPPIQTTQRDTNIVNNVPNIKSPQANISKQEDKKEPVEEMVAIERIIVKESGTLKFKTVFTESKKKALENNELGNCDFCKGTGKVTVEQLGLKDCPRCGGDGNIEGGNQPNESGVPPTNQPQVPNQPQSSSPPLNQQTPAQQPTSQPQEQPKKENPFAKKENPFAKKEEPKKDSENPFEKKSLECLVCPKSVKQFEGWVQRKLTVLKSKSPAHEGVGLLFGIPTIEQKGKKIKGVLAYAGVSLNNRIYLPEELAKGNGKTLPLLLNHSSEAGAEEELDRLDEKMRQHLANGKDYEIGWVTLRWEPTELTLYYEGVINDLFFQNEVDDAQMAVSLGIWYDSDSPRVCDEECYTLIRGAEFREVSLVYHPGFPIATIEAVETILKNKARQQIITESLSAPALTSSWTWTPPMPQLNTTTYTTGITFSTSENEINKKKALEDNPNHEPSGSPEGGQFAPKEGGSQSGSNDTKGKWVNVNDIPLPTKQERPSEKNYRIEARKSLLQSRIESETKFIEQNMHKLESMGLNPEQLSFRKERLEDARKSIDKLKEKLMKVEEEDAKLGLPVIPMKKNTHTKKQDGYVYNNTKVLIQQNVKDDMVTNLLQERIKGMWNSLPDDTRDIVKKLLIKKSTAKGVSWQGGRWTDETKTLTINIHGKTGNSLDHDFFHEVGHARWHNLQQKDPERVKKFIKKLKEIGYSPTTYARSRLLIKEKNEDSERRYRRKMAQGGFIISEKAEKILIRNRSSAEDLYQNEVHSELNAYAMGVLPNDKIIAPKKEMSELLNAYKEMWGLT